MDHEVPTLRSDTSLLAAVDFLLAHHVTGAPVIDDGELVGIFTEKDAMRLLAEGANAEAARGTVADYMTRKVETIPPTMDIYFAAGLFLRSPFRRFPVVDGGRLVGAITRFDILRAIQANLR
jgi:CBS domain-containing protein